MAKKGKIKKIITQRGFGFITAEDGREIFFHRSALKNRRFEELKEGDKVNFDIEKGPKGLRATAIEVTAEE